MFVPYDEMPPHSRVWIYQSSRALSEEEVAIVTETAQVFLEKWSAHGEGLKSSVEVRFNRFLLILLDESHAGASGCSIDASVHFVQNLARELNVDFLDRTLIPFMSNGSVEVEQLSQISSRVEEGKIGPETITFDNRVRDKQGLESSWLVPAGSTWLNKYF